MPRFLFIFFVLLLPSAALADNYNQCVEECDDKEWECTEPSDRETENQFRVCNGVWRTGVNRCREQYSDSRDALNRCIAYRNSQRDSCERNAWRNTAPDRRKCEAANKTCRKDCEKTYGDAGGNAGYRIKPCPPGTSPNALGTCDAVFKVREEAPGEGGCPPEHVPGPYGDCVPKIRVTVTPVPDGYVIACPKGMRPNPVDGGCVVDDAIPTVEPDAAGACPPGTAPGPDDGPCVPLLPRFSTDPALQWLMAQIADTKSLARAPERFAPADLNRQLSQVRDIRGALSATAEAMGMRWEREAE